jgi:D-alanyl-D-alanine carboxypeptidase/D-alanyl-D-alanine-endopeptidase (penicillin-binding protein 4)
MHGFDGTIGPRASRTGFVAALAAAALVLGGCTAGPEPDPGESASPVPQSISAIMDQPIYADGRWGMSVVDLDSGDILFEINPDETFMTGSTAKIFSVTAALGSLGPDATFTTPVLAVGDVANGTLEGDLVLRGVGDLTLGGRTMADGTIDVPIFDHYDANALPGLATLTPEDPLAGLDNLARQVAAAGVTRVAGDVVVDDRLWDPVTLDEVPISPIVVNDNLVDLVLTPGAQEGDPATLEWRPQTAAYTPTAEVTTGAADSGIDLSIDDTGGGALAVTGSIPLGATPVVQTFQVPDPASWARTLFIEALERAGVRVDADPLASNPTGLAPVEELDGLTPIATFTSPPFSETARLINKVSHNLGANQLPLILAAEEGERTLDAGLALMMDVLGAAGLGPDDVVLADGQGLPENVVSPSGMTRYLEYLTGTPTFETFFDSTPILGVDGSLASVLPAGDPAIGHAHAKTGTLVAEGTTSAFLLQTKALAGYLDTAGGRNLAFAVFVNDVPIDEVSAVLQANNDLGAIASQLYQLY